MASSARRALPAATGANRGCVDRNLDSSLQRRQARRRYREWLALASKAGYNVVHAPLAPKYREIAQHNLAKMNAYFHSQEGQDYGYQTMLYSWIDVREDNYVCLPPYAQ